MYYDYCLQFNDEAEATAMLMDGEVPKYAAIDVIGALYKPSGKKIQTEEGLIDEMVKVSGWHVNVRHTEECPKLESYRIIPKTPKRVWF